MASSRNLQDASALARVGVTVSALNCSRELVKAGGRRSGYRQAQMRARCAAHLQLAIWISENRTGIDGFVTVCSQAAPPLASCSSLEITTLYVQPRHQSSGRGAALLHRALDHCRSMRGESAWLKVNAENS